MENKENSKEAISRVSNASISTKQSIDICKFIRGKKIDIALNALKEVVGMKRVIPTKREVPHKKGEGIAGGRYPIKAASVFITALKSLEANANSKSMDLSKSIIYAHADKAPRPHRSGKYGGRKFKRTHITLKLAEEK